MLSPCVEYEVPLKYKPKQISNEVWSQLQLLHPMTAS